MWYQQRFPQTIINHILHNISNSPGEYIQLMFSNWQSNKTRGNSEKKIIPG